MAYAFTFDARSCSGCKACQEACKDKNQLPAGVLWRRVIEVSGGEWHANGNAWESSVFAYYLSLACNHCTHPKCAGVCPTSAYSVLQDGIVLIDPSKCMGCGYCAWACPYGAPQYDAQNGIMTKCDFCYDYLNAGFPPSCVAACPLRVLNYRLLGELEPVEQSQSLWQLPGSQHPFPLPEYSRTEPHLAITLHTGMGNALPKEVSNLEDIIPPAAFENTLGRQGRHELPLVAFTLMIQMAAGMAIYSLGLPAIPTTALISIGILTAAGGLISFLHLGRKRNAWRAIVHLKKSWLSRETLAVGLFSLAWMATAIGKLAGKPLAIQWLMAILGIGLIYSMGRVYLLRSVPAWNRWQTPAAFFLSAAVLGALGINFASPSPTWLIFAGVTMLAEFILSFSMRSGTAHLPGQPRNILLGLGILGIILTFLIPGGIVVWLSVIIFILALVSEVIGRRQFYAQRLPFPVQRG